MNTSHNKNRIIEHGWRNVFKNIIGKPSSSVSIDPDTNDFSADNSTVKIRRDGRKSNKKVVTTGAFVTESSSSLHHNHDSMNDNEIPSTSKEQSDKTGSDSSLTVINVRSLNQTENQKPFSKQLVQDLLDTYDDEEKYLQTFQSFVIFIDYCKGGNDPSKFKLDKDIQHKQHSSTHPVNKSAALKGKCLTSRNKNGKFKGKSRNNLNDPEFNSSTEDKKIFKGDKQERMLLRRKILFKICSCKENTEPFNSLGDKLIELEESFIL